MVEKFSPVIAELVKQGINEGLFKTDYPLEVSEIIVAGVHFVTDLGIFKWSGEEYVKRIKASEELIEKALCIKQGSFAFLSELLHPVTQAEAVKELQSVASNHTQWYLAHMAALFAIILLPYAIQGLLVLLGEHSLILGRTAAGLISVGTVAVSGLLAFDLITWVMAVNGSREEMIRLYDAITQSPGFSLPFLVIGPLILVIGILMLAAALYRSGAVKRWQALCLGTGIFLYGFAGPVFPVSNGPLIVISGAF